ncbi:MAG TPA: ATP-binding protein [Nostocaceae cyanobacterium]|nr:ATP-binding protein [Nostocaceae cyanobacterium]
MLDYLDFFNATIDLCCILGQDGYYKQVNPAWEALLGWQPEDLIGNAWLECMHPQDSKVCYLPTETQQTLHYDSRYLHKNGSYCWFSWSLFTSQTGLIYVIGKDISQYKQQIEALQTERNSLYNLLDQLPAFLYIQPKNYDVGFYNQRFREIFGEPEGKRCYEAIAGLKQRCPICPTFRVFDTNTPQLWEWVDSKNDRIFQIYDYPFTDMNGEQMVVEMGLDITAIKKAEATLRQSELELTQKNQQLNEAIKQLKKTQAQLIHNEKMSSLGQLVGGIAHEINNPVNFINGNIIYAKEYIQEILNFLRLYQAEYPEPTSKIQERIREIELDFLIDDLDKILDSMKTGSDRIRNIVLSLLNFSRLNESEIKEVDIHSGLDSTLMLLQHRFKFSPKTSEIKIIKDYGKLPLLECNASQLNQVWMNIINNAIDALEDAQVNSNQSNYQPQITISTKLLNSDQLLVEITDNGIGIPEEIQKYIFDPFFTTKEVGRGTGLGMSISSHIIREQHQGNLYFISSLGKGTSFIVELPIKQNKSL